MGSPSHLIRQPACNQKFAIAGLLRTMEPRNTLDDAWLWQMA
jgi:hypothetical protein